MALKRITDLTAASALDGTEEVAIEQGGSTVKATTADIAGLASVPPAPVITDATTARDVLPADAGVYLRFTSTGAKTATFDSADGFAAEEEYHITNRAASGNLTLTAAGTTTLNPPKSGTLVLEPGDTVTVKFVASDEADVFGSTEAA